jgi:hypothetical protein
MQNIVKTLMSGFKIFVDKKLKLVDKKIYESIADWNQNDPEANNYVKNRTHWEEKTIIYHVENLTKSMYKYGEKPQCNFIPGNIYNVLWNGVLYDNLVCYKSGAWNIIADESLGCPFYIDDDGGNDLYISSNNEDEKWTVSIYEGSYTVHKIDEKYLPNSTVKTEDLEILRNEVASIISKDDDGNTFINGDNVYVSNSEDPENVEKLITEKNFYEPKKYLAVTDEVDGYNYIITTRNGNIISYIQTRSIEITAMPTKTTYADNEEFNPAGMVITAIGVDGSTREITNYIYDNIVTTSNANNFVISYTEMGITHTATTSFNLHDFSLIDFEYIITSDGKYELTAWKGTYNGEPSTRIIVPDSELIIV